MNFESNRTKIIATLGPATLNLKKIKELILAGVNVFRLNFSHGAHSDYAAAIDWIRKANKETGKNIAIMADLQGPKIRLGEIPGGERKLKLNEDIIFSTLKNKEPDTVYIKYSNFVKDIKIGEKILVDDGKIELEIIRKLDENRVLLRALNSGSLFSKKGVNLPNTIITLPALRKKDLIDLAFALEHGVDWVALSFVRSAANITELKEAIGDNSNSVKIIAKIEKPQALDEIDEIILASDAIMMARGDLGVEVPLERVPLIQKSVVRKCIQKAKPVIIATQMMESMIENAVPTRAEVTDVANAIIDGADAVMLSGETAIGKYPIKVIEIIRRVIENIESEYNIYNKDLIPVNNSPTFFHDAICYNACKLADVVKADAVIGMTRSGYTAYTISSYRPKSRIFIFTDNLKMLNILSLVWGVTGFYYDKMISTDDTIADIHSILLDNKIMQKGDIVINTASMPIHTQGRTNMIKVSTL